MLKSVYKCSHLERLYLAGGGMQIATPTLDNSLALSSKGEDTIHSL